MRIIVIVLLNSLHRCNENHSYRITEFITQAITFTHMLFYLKTMEMRSKFNATNSL